MIQASEMKRWECVELLIEAGADVNTTSYHNFSPLHYATLSDNVECVELLINAGANVNYSCVLGTALEGAIGGGNADCVKLLVPQTENTHGPFAQAAQHGKLECLKVLLESGN